MALKQSNDSIILCPIFKWIYWESVNRFFIFNCWKRIVEFQWRWPSGYCAFIEYSSRWKSLKRSFVLEIWFFVFVWIIIDKVWPFKRCIFEHSKRRIVHSHYGIVYTHCSSYSLRVRIFNDDVEISQLCLTRLAKCKSSFFILLIYHINSSLVILDSWIFINFPI